MILENRFLPIVYRIAPDKENTKRAVSCVEIADEYAIDFANWLNNHVLNTLGDHRRFNGKLKVSDLLIIYKKEKRL